MRVTASANMQTIHTSIWKSLTESHIKGKVGHAYIFSGPSGVGKEDVALEFIRMINDLSVPAESILNGHYPDVLVVQPEIEEKAGKRRVKSITIEQVKTAVDRLGLYPYYGPYQFLLVLAAHKLNHTAANSLLKLIEEPPKATKIILCSSFEDRLLPTIRSRCQRIRFGLSTPEAIAAFLEQKYAILEQNVDPVRTTHKLQQAAHLARGRVKMAEKFLEHPEVADQEAAALERFRIALKAGLHEKFLMVEQLSQDKTKVLAALEQWIWFLSGSLKQQLRQGSDLRAVRKIHTMIVALLSIRAKIEHTNTNERLLLENFFVQM